MPGSGWVPSSATVHPRGSILAAPSLDRSVTGAGAVADRYAEMGSLTTRSEGSRRSSGIFT